MTDLRDPQGIGGEHNSTDQKIDYLRSLGVTVIFDSFGVRLQQVSFRDRNKRFKSWRVNRIWCETLDEAWDKFMKKKWD